MTRNRVVITGLGLVAPHGNNVTSVFDAVFRGESAIRHVDVCSDSQQLSVPGARVLEQPWLQLEGIPTGTCDRVSLMALAAADSAIVDAKLDLTHEDRNRIGVSVGTSLGGASSQELAYQEIFSKGKKRLSPFTLVKVMYNGPASQIALRCRLGGPSLTYTTTCSSSAVSIGEALRQIRHGYADVMIAGGAEALFSYVSMIAWQALHVLAPAAMPDVSATCRPFNRDRNGTVLGEGAAFLVLEELDHAHRRGARVYAELAGYGICNDPEHLTQPSVDGQVRTMQAALRDSGLDASEIDYINAHGTGTQLNDLTETSAIKTVFGKTAPDVAISSTKSTHGHLVGAAGALELILSVVAMGQQRVPPTANLIDPDPRCDLDYVPLTGRQQRVRTIMTNSFAVGGTASTLVAKALA